RQEFRLLPGGEMGALVVTPVEDEVRIGLAGPALGRLVDFVAEGAHAGRQGHAARIEEAAFGASRFPIEPGGRDRRVGEPVEGDIVEDIVAGQARLFSVEYL